MELATRTPHLLDVEYLGCGPTVIDLCNIPLTLAA